MQNLGLGRIGDAVQHRQCLESVFRNSITDGVFPAFARRKSDTSLHSRNPLQVVSAVQELRCGAVRGEVRAGPKSNNISCFPGRRNKGNDTVEPVDARADNGQLVQALLEASDHVAFGSAFGKVNIIAWDVNGMLSKVRQRIARIAGSEQFMPIISGVVLDKKLSAQDAASDDEEAGETKRSCVFVLAVSGIRSAITEHACETYDHGSTSGEKIDAYGSDGDDSEGGTQSDEAENAPRSVQKDEKVLANRIRVISKSRVGSAFTAF